MKINLILKDGKSYETFLDVKSLECLREDLKKEKWFISKDLIVETKEIKIIEEVKFDIDSIKQKIEEYKERNSM